MVDSSGFLAIFYLSPTGITGRARQSITPSSNPITPLPRLPYHFQEAQARRSTKSTLISHLVHSVVGWSPLPVTHSLSVTLFLSRSSSSSSASILVHTIAPPFNNNILKRHLIVSLNLNSAYSLTVTTIYASSPTCQNPQLRSVLVPATCHPDHWERHSEKQQKANQSPSNLTRPLLEVSFNIDHLFGFILEMSRPLRRRPTHMTAVHRRHTEPQSFN